MVNICLLYTSVAVNLVFRVAAFLVPDDHHGLTVEAGQAADDGVVIGKGTVAGHR